MREKRALRTTESPRDLVRATSAKAFSSPSSVRQNRGGLLRARARCAGARTSPYFVASSFSSFGDRLLHGL